jgi:signal transduction histidine kinase
VLGARVVRGELVLVVADNGCGLSTEQRHFVASLSRDPEKAERSLLTEMDLLSGGLGLVIASQYAQEMGGALVHVTGGRRGARFLIRTGRRARSIR